MPIQAQVVPNVKQARFSECRIILLPQYTGVIYIVTYYCSGINSRPGATADR